MTDHQILTLHRDKARLMARGWRFEESLREATAIHPRNKHSDATFHGPDAELRAVQYADAVEGKRGAA